MGSGSLLSILDDTMMAYSDTPTSANYKRVESYANKKSGVEYFTGSKNNHNLMFSFRGSDQLKDWVTDFKFWKTSVPFGVNSKIKIHTGFYRAYNTVKSGILKLTEKHYVPDSHYVIDIFGHSYGAALAILCALDLQMRYPKIQFNVVTFGCPRIGNKAFARFYNKRLIKTLRVENGNDWVTKIPFKFMGFKHVGIKIHIGCMRMAGVFSAKQHTCYKYYESLWNKCM